MFFDDVVVGVFGLVFIFGLKKMCVGCLMNVYKIDVCVCICIVCCVMWMQIDVRINSVKRKWKKESKLPSERYQLKKKNVWKFGFFPKKEIGISVEN